MSRVAQLCYYMECGHFYYQNYNWILGHESFQRAFSLSNLRFELVGIYGKRTRYQQKDLAQLLLKFDKESEEMLEKNDTEYKLDDLKYLNSDLNRNFLPKVNDIGLNFK
jgi:hypothetical protein